MSIPDRYAAYWIPGPDELDMDEGLLLGYRWLEAAPYPGERIVVLYAKKMVGNRATLARAARFHVVSPRSQDIPYGSAGPVLAVWPTPETLELAQRIALDSALCVIPYRHDVSWWVARAGAVNLADPEADSPAFNPLDDAVAGTMDAILLFGGHNSFVGAGEKEDAVRQLREMLAAGHHPDPVDVEQYARASGKTDVEGAKRLRTFYEILAGRAPRDYRRRPN